MVELREQGSRCQDYGEEGFMSAGDMSNDRESSHGGRCRGNRMDGIGGGRSCSGREDEGDEGRRQKDVEKISFPF